MKRPTISDLARAAEVSTATVDRVLNGRAKVREETVQRVHEAARRIGYHGLNVIRAQIMADRPTLRITVVLQKSRHHFYRDLRRLLEETAQGLLSHDLQLQFLSPESQDPTHLAQLLAALAGRADMVFATATDHHEIASAVAALKAKGIPVFSLLSDFAQGIRESYFGLNNLKVGRIVGGLMAKMLHQPGKIGVFIGSSRYHGHVLRETGFRTYLREHCPELTLIDTQFNLETRQLTHEATLQLLDRHPDLVALYVAGGGMEGAISALRLRPERKLLVFVNELTPESASALQEGRVTMVVATPLQSMVADLVAQAILTFEGTDTERSGQRFFVPQLWTAEMLP